MPLQEEFLVANTEQFVPVNRTFRSCESSVTRMEQDAKRAGVTNQRRYLLLYALRLLIFGIAFGAALLLRKRVSPVAVCIPMLYPRLIYTAGALFQKPGKKR